MTPADAGPDHLVVLAATLDEGVRWCEQTLGVTPGPGGRHPLMGTWNRLLRIASPAYPHCYLEIIAIDPAAAAPGRRRWFDMDDPTLTARIRRDGPQLVHWVAQVPDITAALAALQAQGIDAGQALAASRATPQGELRWQIAVREDGARGFDGCLPTLIQWGEIHPAAAMADSGVTLESLALQHPQPSQLAHALRSLGMPALATQDGAARITARLHTPRGLISICS